MISRPIATPSCGLTNLPFGPSSPSFTSFFFPCHNTHTQKETLVSQNPFKTLSVAGGATQRKRSRRPVVVSQSTMPKSKRNKAVTLSKTKKKGREHKESIVSSIRAAAENYGSVFVFSFENMRNLKFKEFREHLKSNSRFFLGSNKVMQVSLGRSASDETRPGLHKVSKLLRGDAGLCFTNLPKEEIERLFGEYEEYDFAKTGSISTEKVELKEGPLEQFTHEMEPFLRKQGMPVRLNKGVVELVSDFVVCEEGKPLSPESARILRLLGIKMATFRLHLICRWSPEGFELYGKGPEDSDIESS